MPLHDVDSEDIALLVSVGVTAAAVLVEEAYGSITFKALKIVSVVVSLGLAAHRIRTRRPFYKDIPSTAWQKIDGRFQTVVPKSEHKRGKFPYARCLSKNEEGTYSECYADASTKPNGDLLLQASQAINLRVEVRK